jgi:hypothetical protein
MDTTEWIRENSWALAPAFIITLAIIIWIKSKLANRIEIKPVDVGIALIPFVLWMATAGIFKKVEVPGILSFETADAIVSAAAAPIDLQVTKMPISVLKADTKEGVFEIPRLIKSGTQVLSFRLGYKGYYGPAIWMYFNHLLRSPIFKYALITDEKGSLFGLFDAGKLTALLNPENNEDLMKAFPLDSFHGLPDEEKVKAWSDFATMIKDSNKTKLSAVSGFVPAAIAVEPDADKKQVLGKMEQRGLEWLPVAREKDGHNIFLGIVERSRLTASLILDVANQLEDKKNQRE